MSDTYYLVAGIIMFVMAAFVFVFSALAFISGKTFYGKYNKLRPQLPEAEQKKRDKIMGFSYLVIGIGLVFVGFSALHQFSQPWWTIGLIIGAVGGAIQYAAVSNFD